MAPNILLNEIMTSQWMMTNAGFFQLGHVIKSITSGNFQEKPKVKLINALSFYNDDEQRIHPNSIADIPENTIAVIKIIGPIMEYGSWYTLGANEVVAQLKFVEGLHNVIGTVVKIHGPGGTVGSINPFLAFKKIKKKPIVGLMDSSLSMHRWIPDVICDYQLASNDITSRFGSIGVVSSWMDFSKYYEAMGIKIHEVYPDESKHKNEIWRTLETDEKKGKQMLKDMQLSPLAIKFQDYVKAAHPNLIQEEGVLTGRTFSAEDAVRLNMINGIGDMEMAMNRVKLLSEINQLN